MVWWRASEAVRVAAWAEAATELIGRRGRTTAAKPSVASSRLMGSMPRSKIALPCRRVYVSPRSWRYWGTASIRQLAAWATFEQNQLPEGTLPLTIRTVSLDSEFTVSRLTKAVGREESIR